jgi:HSP20 family molecular chaperone IbpA
MFAKAGAGDLFMKPRWAPTIEVATRDRDLVVSVELPGLKEDDVKVEINDGVLVIQGRTQGRS